jgi:hypothetical protein
MMHEAPRFFVPTVIPAVKADNQESAYAELAKWCRRPVADPEKRVYSITFVHDGERWTATVGESLRGRRIRRTRSRGTRVEREESVSDPAVVLAIFAGVPYMVVTNHRLAEHRVGSAWENPFLAGEPESVTYFPSPPAG